MGAERKDEEDYPGQNHERAQQELLDELFSRLEKETLGDENYRNQFADVVLDLVHYLYPRPFPMERSGLYKNVVMPMIQEFAASKVERRYLSGLLLERLVSRSLVVGTTQPYRIQPLMR